MRIHTLRHEETEDAGSIITWAQKRGHELGATRLYAGEPVPQSDRFDWLVVMGGGMNVYEEDTYPWLAPEKRLIAAAIEANKTVIGICLGAQLIADVLGAKVRRNPEREIGWYPVELTRSASSSPIFVNLPGKFDAFHWHEDTFEVPERARHIARSEACENQGFVYGDRVIALQFHLEMTPEMASRIIESSKSDLARGTYVQNSQEIMRDNGRFDDLNFLMEALMDGIERLFVKKNFTGSRRDRVRKNS